ncbi:MAG: hypothetical protein K9N21_02210 [Deltaproteobacteria bacterium]|nr:hypothetical protein [Deltaproteobacteria bacterium]
MTHNKKDKHIAYFISPHGFGHAARASAVMCAVHELDVTLHFDIFTTVPSWFFEDSLVGPFTHHWVLTDIGLIQKTPLYADLAGTVERLDRFIPFEKEGIRRLAQEMVRMNCGLVICDIAPMGIAAARAAGMPSLLVENFTWDWVYEEYTGAHSGLSRHADYLGELFSQVDYHVQTEPVCRPDPVDLTVPPVSRRARSTGKEVRQRLNIPDGGKMVLVTMGGVPEDYKDMKELCLPKDVWVVIPGAGRSLEMRGNLIILPHRSEFFHPDLVAAADAVVGKVGYSTLAEIYHGGVPFGYIKRRNFQESDILSAYIADHMSGLAIDGETFRTGEWTSNIPRLLKMPRIRRNGPNGASQIAQFVYGLLRGALG